MQGFRPGAITNLHSAGAPGRGVHSPRRMQASKEGCSMRRLLVACLLTVTAAWSLPAVSSAGTYVDYECRDADRRAGQGGRLRSHRVAEVLGGELVQHQRPGGARRRAGQRADLDGRPGRPAAFQAPADTKITAVSLNRSTSGAPTGSSFLTYQINVDRRSSTAACRARAAGATSTAPCRSAGLDASTLDLTAGCGGTLANTCTTPIRLRATQRCHHLRDDLPPSPRPARFALRGAGEVGHGGRGVRRDGPRRGRVPHGHDDRR